MGLARFIAELSSRFVRRFSSSPEPGENEAHWLGREGERLAAKHLRQQGYKVLYRNFRAPKGGEVDLVCRHRDVLVFVEVKTRRNLAFGTPAEAVTREKQKLIARGAIGWLQLLHNPEILFRFDIVEVVMDEPRTSFQIIPNAFQLPEPLIY